MPKYVLRYFDVRARGELTRLALALKGVDFEDKRFSFEAWPAEKPNTPFGQMPVLTIDGKDYTESLAMARHLAREFDIYGATNQDKYEVDRVIDICQDLFKEYVKVFFEKDEEKKGELKTALKETGIPRFLGNLEKIVSVKANGYTVGDKLSLGDLAIFDIVDVHVSDEILAKFPNVKAIVNNVKANDNIKKYLAGRKQTDL